jgi:hypothetical protein
MNPAEQRIGAALGKYSIKLRLAVQCSPHSLQRDLAMQPARWEYEVLKIEPGGFFGGKVNADELRSLLSELGAKGWELVSTFETNTAQGASRDVVFILKRQA